jgi:hypothetical protein
MNGLGWGKSTDLRPFVLSDLSSLFSLFAFLSVFSFVLFDLDFHGAKRYFDLTILPRGGGGGFACSIPLWLASLLVGYSIGLYWLYYCNTISVCCLSLQCVMCPPLSLVCKLS